MLSLDSSTSRNPSAPPAAVSQTNLLINELFRDYLEFQGYRNTLSVFLPESGYRQSSEQFSREFLSSQLNLTHNQHSKQIPLLYSIIALLQQGKLGNLMKESIEAEYKQEAEMENEKLRNSSIQAKFGVSNQTQNPLFEKSNSQFSSARTNSRPLSASISQSIPQFPGLTPSVTKSNNTNAQTNFSSSQNNESSLNSMKSAKSTGSKSVSFHSPVAEVETVERISYDRDDDQDYNSGEVDESYEEDDFYNEER